MSPSRTVSPSVSPSVVPQPQGDGVAAASKAVPVAVIAGASVGAGLVALGAVGFAYWYRARLSYGKVGETTQLLASA